MMSEMFENNSSPIQWMWTVLMVLGMIGFWSLIFWFLFSTNRRHDQRKEFEGLIPEEVARSRLVSRNIDNNEYDQILSRLEK